MEILILTEPTAGGRFRARAGEPFAIAVEGGTREEAVAHLEALLRARLQAGSQLAVLDLGNGPAAVPTAPLKLGPLPDDDWVFQTMREAIAENRQREDEAAAGGPSGPAPTPSP